MKRQELLERFNRDMQISNFSRNTIQSYLYYLDKFIEFCGEFPENVEIELVKKFLFYLQQDKKYSPSTLNMAYSALKTFYTRTMEKEWPHKYINRAKQEHKLPVIFTQDEIGKLLLNITNLKHRAILTLIYSSGLRISELIALTPQDIDSKQMYVKVRRGKGNKDRNTLLSEECLKILRDYYKTYKPTKYLFNGKKKAHPYSVSSIRRILEKAVKKAIIKKEVTVHSLRHSFATHLLENGVNIFYIKELLGHNSIKTTMVYFHLCSKEIKKIENPFDKIVRGRKK